MVERSTHEFVLVTEDELKTGIKQRFLTVSENFATTVTPATEVELSNDYNILTFVCPVYNTKSTGDCRQKDQIAITTSRRYSGAPNQMSLCSKFFVPGEDPTEGVVTEPKETAKQLWDKDVAAYRAAAGKPLDFPMPMSSSE